MDRDLLTAEIEETNDVVQSGELENEKKESKKKSRVQRSFPQYSIEECLIIAKSIAENNSGNPWSPEQIANSINLSPKTKRFIYLAYASRDYGLTTGTKSTETIELTALGRKAVFPKDQIEEREALDKAFENIDVFKQVHEYYQKGGLPERRFLFNTLQENFLIPAEFHDEFYSVYTANISYLNSKGDSLKCVPSNENSTNIGESHDEFQNAIQTSNKELFVIMPFTEKTGTYPQGFFDEVFSSLIVPAASNAGFNPQTANKSGSDIIHKTIVSGIYNAEIILADLTEHNPNVLFELGLAIAFKKKVAIIRAKGTKPIFDVDNSIRVLDYSPNLWKSTLGMDVEKLTQHLIAVSESDSDCYLDIFLS